MPFWDRFFDTSPSSDHQQHVVPRGDGWAVRRGDADRASKVFTDKAQAMEYAIGLARHQGGTLVVHGRDGRIQEQRDYT